MKEYVVNRFTSIFPFGIIAKGEILTEKHLDKLGENVIADMVKRGVISAIDDVPDAETGAEDAARKEEPADELPPVESPEEEQPDAEDEGATEEEVEEPAELEIESIDEIVEDQADTPASKKGSSGKGKKK